MYTPEHEIKELGRKTAVAVRRKDVPLAEHFRRYFDKSISIESPEDKAKARIIFNAAYREENGL